MRSSWISRLLFLHLLFNPSHSLEICHSSHARRSQYHLLDEIRFVFFLPPAGQIKKRLRTKLRLPNQWKK